MAHKIAIIITKNCYYNYGDDYETILQSITNWEEVTDEEFDDLVQASYRMGFQIMEQPAEPKKFIAKTISDYKTLVKEEKRKEAEEKKKRADAALVRKHKKELKDRESKLALIKKLQAELGPEGTI